MIPGVALIAGGPEEGTMGGGRRRDRVWATHDPRPQLDQILNTTPAPWKYGTAI